MGCFHSKNDGSGLNAIFRVVNVNENGYTLSPGQLEITDTELVLYREGIPTTVWPLHSLRRYGFEGDIFSFESGRRCDTGEGIYAFKCRKAAPLFRTLQEKIQIRNAAQDAGTPGLSPLPHGRQTLQASVVHRSSLDNGQPDQLATTLNNNLSNISQSGGTLTNTPIPGSPSNADILEVTPLYPQSRTTNHQVTNVYQLRDFKREHNNNTQLDEIREIQHEYTNDFIRDLTMLRYNLKRENALNTMREIEDENRFLESQLNKEHKAYTNYNNPISPTLSGTSEHYAQLSMDQQDGSRLYVNISKNDINVLDKHKVEILPLTPLTPKQVDYCNLVPCNKSLEINTYANLSINERIESVKTAILSSSELNQKFSESDTLTSMSPVEELEVSYAVLDIDPNKEGHKLNADLPSPKEKVSCNSSLNENSTTINAQSRGRLVSQNSAEKAPMTTAPSCVPLASIGYTTIDFDKTVALTSVAAGTDTHLENARKTRQNSCGILCASPPTNADKNRIY